MYKLAKARLCAIWDALHPPKTHSHLTAFFPTASPPACVDADEQRSYEDAVFIILFAR